MPIILLLLSLFLAFPAAAAPKFNVQKELSYRVEFGSPADVKMLLEKGGDPNGVNELGWPLVSVAARRVDGLAVEVVDMLAQAGADLNQGGASRQYPIIIAARNGDADLANYLLLKGVDVDVRDRNGVQPVEIAQKNGHEDVFDILEVLAMKAAEEKEKMHSPERYKELRRELSVASCSYQYMNYYFKSGQDKFSDDYIADKTSEWEGRLISITNDLYQIFKMPLEDMELIRNYAAKAVYADLERLISNRNRRSHGVGTEADRTKRCGAIADKWEASQVSDEDKEKAKSKFKKLRKGAGSFIQ